MMTHIIIHIRAIPKRKHRTSGNISDAKEVLNTLSGYWRMGNGGLRLAGLVTGWALSEALVELMEQRRAERGALGLSLPGWHGETCLHQPQTRRQTAPARRCVPSRPWSEQGCCSGIG